MPKPKQPIRYSVERTFFSAKLELRALPDGEKLPKGVCGRVQGVALVYGQVDDYGTVFAPGCLSGTRALKVAQRKVKLFADHGPFTDTHVGVVTAMDDLADSVVMTADLFDTDAGRKMKEYIENVLLADAETGLSIGFRPTDRAWEKDEATGEQRLVFREIELREVSVTPAPAVSGATVTGVRRESEGDLPTRMLEHILKAMPEREARAVFDAVYVPGAAKSDTSGDPPETEQVPGAVQSDAATEAERNATGTGSGLQATEQERLAIARRLFGMAAA
jgi:HK97 family phage prohead protease